MELTPQEERKLKKISKFLDNNELATVDSFIELEDKVDLIGQTVDSRFSDLTDSLKKKLESELVLEIDREELIGDKGDKGEKGDTGKDGIDGKNGLDGKDGKDGKNGLDGIDGKDGLDGKDGSPDTGEEIITKINDNETSLIKANKIDGFSLLSEDIKVLKSRPIQFESGRGGGGGNIEVFEDGTKRGSGSAINFGSGFDVTHDGHKAYITLDAAEPTNFTLQKVTDNGATTTNDITVNSITETVPTLLILDQSTPQALTATDTPITASDEIYFGDVTDGTKIKKDTIQGILDLVPSPDLSAYVPYIGATTDVDLGLNNLTAENLITTKHIYLPDTDDLSGTYGIIYKANVPFIHNYHKLFATDGTTPLDGQNLFIGKDAGNFTMGNTATSAEQASNNLGIGKEALKSVTTGYDNVGIGALSSSKITTGRGNIYIGGNAGASNTTLSYNIGIGQNSVKSAIAAGGNLVGVGYETLMSVQGGGSFTAVGTSAGRTIVSDGHSSFFGFKSGYYTKGGACTFIGSEAGLGGSSTATTGTFNTAVGYQALRSYTSGQRNTMVGQSSGYSITSGQRNTGVGSEVLYGLKTGSYNTAIGEGAGRYYSTGTSAHTSGTYSVFLGRLTRPLGNAQTNQIVIGNDAVGFGSNTATLGNNSITNTYLKGIVLVNNKISFTQTDNNEFIDSLNDGYMDYGATTAHRFNNPLFIANIKSGATQAGASASAGEVWKTSGHATLPDNVLMIGV